MMIDDSDWSRDYPGELHACPVCGTSMRLYGTRAKPPKGDATLAYWADCANGHARRFKADGYEPFTVTAPRIMLGRKAETGQAIREWNEWADAHGYAHEEPERHWHDLYEGMPAPCPICRHEVFPSRDKWGSVFISCEAHPQLGRATAQYERDISRQWNDLVADWLTLAAASCRMCEREHGDPRPRLHGVEDKDRPYACSCACTTGQGSTWQGALHDWKRRAEDRYDDWLQRHDAAEGADRELAGIEETRRLIQGADDGR